MARKTHELLFGCVMCRRTGFGSAPVGHGEEMVVGMVKVVFVAPTSCSLTAPRIDSSPQKSSIRASKTAVHLFRPIAFITQLVRKDCGGLPPDTSYLCCPDILPIRTRLTELIQTLSHYVRRAKGSAHGCSATSREAVCQQLLERY